MLRFSTEWSDEHLAILRNLWPNHSGGEIAKLLKRSRNSVIGKANRLGLVRKTTKGEPSMATRPPKVVQRIAPRKAVMVAVHELPPEGGISILKIGHNQCRAIIGHDTVMPKLAMMCGKPVSPDSRFSFCDEHNEKFVTKSISRAGRFYRF